MEKKFKIDVEIYSEEIIGKALVDYEEIPGIKFFDWNIIISWENELEIDEIFNEFFNYVIWLYNER